MAGATLTARGGAVALNGLDQEIIPSVRRTKGVGVHRFRVIFLLNL
ncbi:MAG: hypothetical protein IMF18_08200 [Proteobacteria bacterium]|nr:hypothetical protein [Pseudomonadota bacterium]